MGPSASSKRARTGPGPASGSASAAASALPSTPSSSPQASTPATSQSSIAHRHATGWISHAERLAIWSPRWAEPGATITTKSLRSQAKKPIPSRDISGWKTCTRHRTSQHEHPVRVSPEGRTKTKRIRGLACSAGGAFQPVHHVMFGYQIGAPRLRAQAHWVTLRSYRLGSKSVALLNQTQRLPPSVLDDAARLNRDRATGNARKASLPVSAQRMKRSPCAAGKDPGARPTTSSVLAVVRRGHLKP